MIRPLTPVAAQAEQVMCLLTAVMNLILSCNLLKQKFTTLHFRRYGMLYGDERIRIGDRRDRRLPAFDTAGR